MGRGVEGARPPERVAAERGVPGEPSGPKERAPGEQGPVSTVLVTNDDGIESPGLRALAEAARSAGVRPVVVAPCWDSSGASAAVTGVQDDLQIEL